MRQLEIRPRWLALCALIVAALLSVSVSTGLALGSAPPARFRGAGFGGNSQNPCGQTGFGGPSPTRNQMADPTSAIAAALNLPVARLQQEIASGESLSQIMDSAAMTSQQVSDAAVARQKDQLDQQVANGRLTLDQETAILATLRSDINDVLSGKSPLTAQVGQSGGFGHRGSNDQQAGRSRFNGCGG